jgi:hypothetical protein
MKFGTTCATLSSFACHAWQGWQLITVTKGAAAGQGVRLRRQFADRPVHRLHQPGRHQLRVRAAEPHRFLARDLMNLPAERGNQNT